ncbi:MAG: helicase [Chloroflexi bacterium]|nr:helicase [Chloroflexota bacterium]
MGTRESKAGEADSLFKAYGCGVATCRDAWAYNFHRATVESSMKRTIDVYNDHVTRWLHLQSKPQIDDFVNLDSKQISWGRDLKKDLNRGTYAQFHETKIRVAAYRPFIKQLLFFDRVFNEEVYQQPQFFPITETENHNRLICISDKGHREAFSTLMVNVIPDFHILATKDRFQCFPFYTYAEDGSNRCENITDWALEQFRTRYPQAPLTKWDIFHYVYGVLHHPEYRSQYAANLRRELPRIPFVQDFWGFAQAGAQLAELHVNYEKQPEYRLNFIENADKPLNWRVERMKLSKDKRSLIYNDFLTLDGIPPQIFDYKLGNRSALEWIVDQYQVSVDTRSGISNDPNQADDPQAIVRLIGQVITVSLATVQLVNGLPPLVVLE